MIRSTRKPGRTIVHLRNSLTTTTLAPRQDHVYPVGPIEVRVAKPEAVRAVKAVTLRVADTEAEAAEDDGAVRIALAAVNVHEVLVIDWA